MDEYNVEDESIVGVVTAKNPQSIVNPIVTQRPMLLQMPVMQQNQLFPLVSFLFPRVAMMLAMMQGGGYGHKRIAVQNITQIIRDKNGYISEIIEFVR